MHSKAQFLSQLFYWQGKTKSKDGFFYKTYKDWHDEIRVPKHSISRYAAEFEKAGLLTTKVAKVNGAPTLHYKLNTDKLTDLLVAFCNDGKLQIVTLESDNLQLSEESDNLQPSINRDYHRLQTDIYEPNGSPPEKAQPKSGKKSSPKSETTPKGKTLFKTNFSGAAGLEKFKAALAQTNYVTELDVNLDYYYHCVMDWSSSKGQMRADWIATARTFMRRDVQDKKLVTNATTTTNGKQATTTGRQEIDFDAARRATERVLERRGIM